MNVIFVRHIVPILCLAGLLSACAAPDKPRPIHELTPEQVINRLSLSDADWGLHVIDLDSGKELSSRTPDNAFPPASTAKILTMVAALSILGGDYTFETSLLSDGVIDGNLLRGDLVLTGTGDPLLRTNGLRQLAIQLGDLGIRHIDGDFMFLSTLPTFAVIESNQPKSAPYNQGVGGLNLDFNRVRLTGRPDGTYFLTPNEAKGLTPAISHVLPNGVIDVPVNQPGMFTARMFQKFAEFEGISLPDPRPYDTTTAFRPLTSIKSLPLSEIARAGLEYSNNMVAETIGLAASTSLDSTPKSLKTSARKLSEWVRNHITKEKRFAPNLVNHSGLSAASRITPREMTTLLHAVFHRAVGSNRFDTLLPPGGGREGFRGRFRQPFAAYRVWGKTGSMRFIKGLAGYAETQSGRRLAFSIFTNDLHQRHKMKLEHDTKDARWRTKSSAWRDKAEAFESEMIRRWISNY